MSQMSLATLVKRCCMSRSRKLPLLTGIVLAVFIGLLGCVTSLSLAPLPLSLSPFNLIGDDEGVKARFVDREGSPLSFTYLNRFNRHHSVHSSEIPLFLMQAVVRAEDKRFYRHRGIDLIALTNALFINGAKGKIVRGGSTITEQVARIITPRPRGIWSRWLYAVEAIRLERYFPKQEILEFYLNQAPFSSRRRGVVEAARHLLSRDLSTLSRLEMCALAVALRAPSLLNPHTKQGQKQVRKRVLLLLDQLRDEGTISQEERELIGEQKLSPQEGSTLVDASHFLRFLMKDRVFDKSTVVTTIDSSLQAYVGKVLERRVERLSSRGVVDGGVVVVDNKGGDVRAWSCAGRGGCSSVDPVTALRQPGSTLKPFLYGLTLERGWSSATLLNDAPLALPAGRGLKDFRNFSNRFYGPVTLRVALANSLNIPAIHAIRFVRHSDLLRVLQALGFRSLDKHSHHYGEGLALGNGEVSLFELVNAYRTFANRGVYSPLRMTVDESREGGTRVFSSGVSSIILDILSDNEARSLEFDGDLLSLPRETAIKTGTSTDFRDAWIVGVSSRYTVGVWMGDLMRSSMREVTGSEGPGVVLRSIFAYLERDGMSRPLPQSDGVERRRICALTGRLAGERCPSRDELFIEGSHPHDVCSGDHEDLGRLVLQPDEIRDVRIVLPTPGLQLAVDARIPEAFQEFPFLLEAQEEPRAVSWILNGEELSGRGRRFLWRVRRGHHTLHAIVESFAGDKRVTQEVRFEVK